MERAYAAIDLKSFYASVECVERGLDPLRANLVVADESRSDKTICLAVTPPLKAYGLSGRSRLFEVKQRLHEIQMLTGQEIPYLIAPPRMAKYIEYSADIYEVYLKYVSPEDIHVYSIDECFLDLTNYRSLYRMRAHELVMMMIRDVLKTTGITATAGIGTNLYLAKIAMDIMAKRIKADKDGVRIAELDERKYREQLWEHRPLTDFWRIGRGTERRLNKKGIFTMGDLARFSLYDVEPLYKEFGIDAELLIDHAWGEESCTMEDIKAYKPETNSFSSGQVLSCPYSWKDAKLITREMIDLMVLDLVDKGLAASSVTLHIGYDRASVDSGSYHGPVHTDFYGRSVPDSAHGTVNFEYLTSSTQKITEGVMNLYDQIADPELLIRRITISVNKVEKQTCEQCSLFDDPIQREKERKIQQTTLKLKKRFGKNAVIKGMNLFEAATAVSRNQQIGGHRA
ncbi:MAG: DNA methylase [Clostridiales bacterium]|nr:DNA methylase [Clostridiales bacterium]